MVEETYRGHIVQLSQWAGHWFVASIVNDRDRSPLIVSGTGSRSFAQALAYAKLLIDSSGGATGR
jgi:hypothetical protein